MAFVEGAFQVYDSLINYDPWIVRAYSPLGALALEAGLHYLCFAALASRCVWSTPRRAGARAFWWPPRRRCSTS